MNTDDIRACLRELYGLEAASFLRYVCEVSRPPVTDDVDAQAKAVIDSLYAASSRVLDALGDSLDKVEEETPEPRFALVFTNYNFLRPRYLIRPLLEPGTNAVGAGGCGRRAIPFPRGRFRRRGGGNRGRGASRAAGRRRARERRRVPSRRSPGGWCPSRHECVALVGRRP